MFDLFGIVVEIQRIAKANYSYSKLTQRHIKRVRKCDKFWKKKALGTLFYM